MKTHTAILIVWALAVYVNVNPVAKAVAITFTEDGMIQEGDDYEDVFVYGDTTTVEITGGQVGILHAYDRSITNISGGSVSYAQSNGHSTINIAGGMVRQPRAWHDGTVNVSGGTCWNIEVQGGALNLSGGQVTGMGIYASKPDSMLNIYGYGFEYIPFARGNDGQLTGFWQNGTPFYIDFRQGAYHMAVLHEIQLNSAPIANASQEQSVLLTAGAIAEVTLDGSASSDPDGDELTYEWTWAIDGDIYKVDGVTPTIQLPHGEHIIELIVNDGAVDSKPDYVVIIALTLAERINTVRADKLQLLEQIDAMSAKEREVIDALDELLASGDYGDLIGEDIIEARQKIRSAMQHQEQLEDAVQKSIENLEDALRLLGSPVELQVGPQPPLAVDEDGIIIDDSED